MATDTSSTTAVPPPPPSPPLLLSINPSQSENQNENQNHKQDQDQEHEHEQPQNPIEMTCQCGQISLLLPHAPKRALECQCSICFRYGALWTYYPRGRVLVTAAAATTTTTTDAKASAVSTVDVEGEGESARMRKYIRDGERMGFLEFHFCGRCGCVTHWWGVEREDGQEKMGVNVRMLGVEGLRGVKRRVHKGPD